jgi:hypothetical protein
MSSLLQKMERVRTDTLTLHPENARRGDVPAIAESLARNGQFAPIVVQESTRYVLSGNHTLLGARSLGWSTVDAVFVDVDDDQARRILLAANRTADRGGYDEAAILQMLAHLDGDIQGTGYAQDDIDAMLTREVIPKDEPAPPPRPAAPKPTAAPGGDDEEQDDDEEPAPATKGLGKPVISYTLVFDNEVQQTAWYEFIRTLRGRYADLETIGERVHAYLGSLPS